MKKTMKFTVMLIAVLLMATSCDIVDGLFGGDDTTDGGVTVNKTVLVGAIDAAQGVLAGETIGNLVGNITQLDADTFTDAIDEAIAVNTSSDSTQGIVDFAVTTLESASTSFTNSVITAVSLVNSDFEATLGSEWDIWVSNVDAPGATMAIVSGVLEVDVTTTNSNSYDPKLFQAGIELVPNRTYVLSFKAKADAAKDININIGKQLNAAPWYVAFMGDAKSRSLTTTWDTYTFSFATGTYAETTADLIFELSADAVTTKVYFDDITITPGNEVAVTYELAAAIVDSNAVFADLAVGTSGGNVSQADYDVYEAAITAAEAVAAEATADVVLAAYEALITADEALEAARVSIPDPTTLATATINVGAGDINFYDSAVTADVTYTQPTWDSSDLTNFTINVGGTDYTVLQQALTGFVGVEVPSQLNITGKTTLHLSYYSNTSTDVKIKLVNFLGGVYNTGTNSELELTFTPSTATWTELELDFSSLTNTDYIKQIIITGTEGSIWYDNIYFK